MRFGSYLLARLLTAVPVLLGISVIVFLLLKLVPGDPAVTLLGSHATPSAVAALHRQLGLDHPLWDQYWLFLRHAVTGNFGESFAYRSPVGPLVGQQVAPTLWLIVTAGIFAVLISTPLAVWAASRRGGVADGAIRIVPLLGLGMPSFWIAILLVWWLGLKAHAFPVSGFGDTVGQHVHSIILPGLTVAVSMVPILVRSLRASLVGVLASDYVTTARAKGLSPTRVVVGHALRNAATSSVTVLGVNLAFLVGNTVIVEKVFALPGMGQLMLNAILSRDLPVVQAVTLIFAVLVVAVNLLTDLAHAALDPRVALS